jgi:ribosome biogenesis GTPase A
MARAIREIQNTPIIDLIIEVVDARCIKTSHNDELTKIFNKPKLTIALKSDLSDVSSYDDVLIGSTFNKGFKKIVFNQIDKILSEKKNKFLSKGLLVPQFYIIVLGLPNVGKSSLIKFLSSGKKLLISNRPGVTKSKQLIKITDNYFLYDTPGVMVKKIDTDEDGYKLGLVNIISKDVLPKYDCVK